MSEHVFYSSTGFMGQFDFEYIQISVVKHYNVVECSYGKNTM